MASKTDQPTVEQRKSRAYNKAFRRLREAHKADWETFISEEYQTEGLEYRPRLTPKQRAQKTIEDLLAEYPELKDEVPF